MESILQPLSPLKTNLIEPAVKESKTSVEKKVQLTAKKSALSPRLVSFSSSSPSLSLDATSSDATKSAGETINQSANPPNVCIN